MSESQKRQRDDQRASKEAQDWIVRLSSGNITDAELSRFKAWRDKSHENAVAFARERKFWQQLGAADSGVDARPQGTPPASLGRRAFLLGSAAAAASAAVVVAPKLKLFWEADYRTAAGEQSDIVLPDGTQVTLNTDSALALHFRPNLRRVELLQGEAFFDVQTHQEAPFRVTAFGGAADINHGTLAVRALDDEAVITMMQGGASVSSPGIDQSLPFSSDKAVRLAAEQQIRYLRGNAPAAATAVDIQQALAWRTGRVIFDGKPFAEAMAELGRYVPERILLADRSRSSDPVSAVFSIRQAFDAISALADTQGLTVRRIPRMMIVVS
jgi:transmembrane sensor